jgi:hypothetical protein
MNYPAIYFSLEYYIVVSRESTSRNDYGIVIVMPSSVARSRSFCFLDASSQSGWLFFWSYSRALCRSSWNSLISCCVGRFCGAMVVLPAGRGYKAVATCHGSGPLSLRLRTYCFHVGGVLIIGVLRMGSVDRRSRSCLCSRIGEYAEAFILDWMRCCSMSVASCEASCFIDCECDWSSGSLGCWD